MLSPNRKVQRCQFLPSFLLELKVESRQMEEKLMILIYVYIIIYYPWMEENKGKRDKRDEGKREPMIDNTLK